MGRYWYDETADGEGCFLRLRDIILAMCIIAFLIGAGFVWLLTWLF